MPNILFASNNIAHFPTSVSGSLAGTFDDSRVPYSIALSNHELVNSPIFVPTTNENTWFNFRTYSNTTDDNHDTTYFQCYDASGNLLVELKKLLSTDDLLSRVILHNGTTTNEADSTIPMTLNKMNIVSIHLRVTSLLIELDLYINQSLSASVAFASNPNSFGDPVRFSIGSAFVDSPTDTQYYSEIMVADGDTRNGRLDLLRPDATGANSDWLGSLGVLADDDTTTGLTTVSAAQRQTMLMTAYTGAANISNFVSVSSTTRGANSPTGLQHTVRLSGINYDGAVHPIDFALSYQLTDFNVNPATSLPWHGDDLSLIETGFVSVA